MKKYILGYQFNMNSVIKVLTSSFLIIATSAVLAQSPYALIGTDIQGSGPVGWVQGADLGKRMQYIMEAWAMGDEFMGSVLIAENGDVVYKGAFGMASESYDVVNTSETRYLISYMSFHFTQFAIAQFVEKDELHLDEPVSNYLPDLQSQHFDEITIRHLLNFESGLNESLEGFINTREAHDLNYLLKLIDDQPLIAPPGNNYAFGWASPILLAKVIENLSQKSYSNFIKEDIVDKLNLSNTGFYRESPITKNLSTPYSRIFNELVPYDQGNIHHLGPQGAMFSTITDLYDFYNYVSDWLGKATERGKEAMGIVTYGVSDGLLVRDIEKHPSEVTFDLLDTNGWFNGSTGLLTCLTDQKSMIIVLSNKFRASEIYDIRRRFMRSIYDLPVGMPLPKTRMSIWQKLKNEGYLAAAKYYEKLVSQGIGSVPLRDEFMHLSRELRNKGEYTQALELSRMFVEMDDQWVAHRELGEVYRLMGETELAKESFKKSLQRKPSNPNWKKEMEKFLKNEP
ncbi:MAG: serine hydrolase [Cyclobacteriaceae bacterium]